MMVYMFVLLVWFKFCFLVCVFVALLVGLFAEPVVGQASWVCKHGTEEWYQMLVRQHTIANMFRTLRVEWVVHILSKGGTCPTLSSSKRSMPRVATFWSGKT